MTKQQIERQERLLPGGEPRWVRIYDSGPEFYLDRYTVIYTGNYKKTRGSHNLTAMSENPLVPGGFFQHDMHPYQCDCIRTSKAKGRTEGNWPPAMGRKCHLGKRIPFSDLNDQCKKAVLQDYAELWEL